MGAYTHKAPLDQMHQDNDCNLKISQLRALVAVADYSNFSSAALRLGLSQSTVSHAIATLEEELGVILLVRGRHGARLTYVGEQVLPEARQILHLLESIQKKANLAKGLQDGQVSVASVRSIANYVLPEAIAQFRQQLPTISVAIVGYTRYAEVEQALREGRADIGLTALPTSDEFEVWELLQDEFVVLLPPGLLHPDVPLSWERLTNYPMIMTPSNHHYRIVSEHLRQFGYTLKLDYEVREDSTIISMVKQGLGATIVARLAAEPIPQEVQVRSLPVPLMRTIGVAVLANALHPPSVFAFLEILKNFK